MPRARRTTPENDLTNDPMTPTGDLSDQGGPVAQPTPVKPAVRVRRKTKVQSSTETPSGNDLGQVSDTANDLLEPVGTLPYPPEVTHDLGIIISLWRQRQDLRRAELRLNLQCQSICRREAGGDKTEGGKLWGTVKKGTCDKAALVAVLLPYRRAMAELDQTATALEKVLVKTVRKLPIWTDWGKDIRGLGELSLAGYLGEAGRPLTDYRSVSALWKRMGLAVIGGERQRKIADKELALVHGYSPQRRSYAYVMSTNLIKSQRAEDPYRQVYDRRKEYELANGHRLIIAHNRAMRVMIKELVKHSWVAARRIEREAQEKAALPIAA